MPRKTNANPKVPVSDIVQPVPDRDYFTFTTAVGQVAIDAFVAANAVANPGLADLVAGAVKVKYSLTELGVVETLIVSK